MIQITNRLPPEWRADPPQPPDEGDRGDDDGDGSDDQPNLGLVVLGLLMLGTAFVVSLMWLLVAIKYFFGVR